MLIGISNFLQHYWWLIGPGGHRGRHFIQALSGHERGRRAEMDEWKMKVPVFGKVMKFNLFGQFARTLGTLLQNGVPVLTALKITEQVIPNRSSRRPSPRRARR